MIDDTHRILDRLKQGFEVRLARFFAVFHLHEDSKKVGAFIVAIGLHDDVFDLRGDPRFLRRLEDPLSDCRDVGLHRVKRLMAAVAG